MTKYRQVGGRLGAYIRANNPNTQQIQGLLADLLAGDELLPAMRDVTSRSSFAPLKALAGSGKGRIQLDFLLLELGRSYLPQIIDSIDKLISGMLDLPERSTKESRSPLLGSPLIQTGFRAASTDAIGLNKPPTRSSISQVITSSAGREEPGFQNEPARIPKSSLSMIKLVFLFLPMTALLVFVAWQINYLDPNLMPNLLEGIQRIFKYKDKKETTDASIAATSQMTIPIRVGMEYAYARTRLVDVGWQPYMPPGADILSCFSQLRACGAGRRPRIGDIAIDTEKENRKKFREKGFYETIDCRETGTGACYQYFTNARGEGLIVETSSGSYDPRAGVSGAPIVYGFGIKDNVEW